MGKTNIEWTGYTLNPFVGCSKCSPACENCYAMRFAARLAKNPSKHCGSSNVELMYLGSKNRLDGGPDTPPITKCRDCGKWSDEPIERNFEMPTDKIHEFMEAVMKISKSLKNQENNKDKAGETKIKPCPFCGSENVCVARPQEWEVGDVCYMHCNSCYTSTQLEPDVKTAIEHWNRRS